MVTLVESAESAEITVLYSLKESSTNIWLAEPVSVILASWIVDWFRLILMVQLIRSPLCTPVLLTYSLENGILTEAVRFSDLAAAPSRNWAVLAALISTSTFSRLVL
ncbi:hypothetical protein D3C75_596930 [compost metagenome]